METQNEKIISIIDSFKKKDIIIILASYQINRYNIDIGFQHRNNQFVILNKFLKIQNSFTNQRLTDKQCLEIFEILKDELKKYSERVIFIIFNEYFFARDAITEDERKEIIQLITDKIDNDNDVFLLMNFLYKLNNPLEKAEKEDLINYLIPINNDTKLFNLNPTNKDLITDDIDIWFTNESVLVYNKKIIFSQKKQTYYNELNFSKFNFSLGFGEKQTKLNINEPEYKLYKYLDSDINIDICLDLQKKYSFYRQKFMNDSISYLDENDQKIIKNKRILFKKYEINGENYENKNYYIIQSNTTNINDSLGLFPNKKIIIQVDPVSSGIFLTNYMEGFDYKISYLKNMRKNLYEKLYLRNKEFTQDFSCDEKKQEIEYSRTKKNADEVYDELINEIFKRNFYNIIEAVRPDEAIFKTIDNISLEILEYDLKKLKFE